MSSELVSCGEPGVSECALFAADTVLLGAAIITLGIPLYHTYGISGSFLLAFWYMGSAVALPVLLPTVVWRLRVGRPDSHIAFTLAKGALAYSVPAVLVTGLVVHAGLLTSITGVALMSFAAAVMITVVGASADARRVSKVARYVRWAAIVLTPIIVLGLTNELPHGLDAIQGWSVPLPALVAGAHGATRTGRRLRSS